MMSVLCLHQVNICFSLQVNKKLNSELVCLVLVVPPVNMLCQTVVFANDRSDPSCVVCCIRDRLPSTDRVYTGFQVSQLL